MPGLHIITDDVTLARPSFDDTAAGLLAAGGNRVALHIRGHATCAAALYRKAMVLRPVAAAAGARLIVNDRVDVAMCAGADGVQLGHRSPAIAAVRRLLPRALTGASAHSPDEAATAFDEGADFVILGAIWETPTHPRATAAGIDLLRETTRHAHGPVFAIGGVTPARVAAVLDAGGAGVAILSGIWSAPSPHAALDAYLRALDRTEAHA